MVVALGEKRSRGSSGAARVDAHSSNAKNAWKDLVPSEHDEQETDRLLSEELLRLDFRERNNINEEIHGVRNACPENKEDPEFIELALLDMDYEVESILERRKYEANFGLTIDHINSNRKLRLSFLRTELYDAKKAADRLVTFTRFVRDQCACGRGVAGCNCGCLGDRDTGGRIIAEKWFTRQELSDLKKGAIQMMPFRDQSGRRVLVALSACFKIRNVTRLKMILYLLLGASEDVETQKVGFVILIWPGMCQSVTPSNTGLFDSIYDRRAASDLQMGIPLRVVCIHFGNASSPLLRLARMLLVTMMHEHSRLRFNIITGTKIELNYKIMGFGIQPEMIPVTDNGTIKTRNHVQWLETRKLIEKNPYGSLAETSGVAVVGCPGINDVLFHRGKSCQYHPGNVAFRSMLESKKRQHLAANQTMKKEIAYDIMVDVENSTGRFLYWDKSGWWVEFENRTEIRHKVATSLRDFNKQTKAANNRQNTHSSTHVFRGPEAKKQKRDHRGDSDESSDCSCPGLTICI
eukprot:CAMPEP_0116146866 /NCGR_PEP_ID=MMETSP0329-20121206/17413_1 /TAXON_ID=697910 /ORGANISM="Pseudo-nitzschia arenysensis, Strain B593" /LENGTH=520 /DNA_ID=CAMNT_0003642683 /DNA_START=86 /DNA_END=1648 /DNA_ORIENTATION=-